MLHPLVVAIRRQYFGVVALALVLAAGADAATGGNVILGRMNSANTTTTLRNTSDGPALTLNVKQGEPPLAVNSGVEVPRLNASRLNGKRSGAFLPRGSWPLVVDDLRTPSGGRSPDGDATQGLRLPYFWIHFLTAPGNGVVRVSAFGNCIGHGHMVIDVNTVRHEVEVGDGVCGLQRAFPVTFGDSLEVQVIVSDFDEETTMELEDGSLAVVFEPS